MTIKETLENVVFNLGRFNQPEGIVLVEDEIDVENGGRYSIALVCGEKELLKAEFTVMDKNDLEKSKEEGYSHFVTHILMEGIASIVANQK